MKNHLLIASLTFNVIMVAAYSSRYKRYEKLAERQANLGYRTNSLLQEHGIEPDPIIQGMLKDLWDFPI